MHVLLWANSLCLCCQQSRMVNSCQISSTSTSSISPLPNKNPNLSVPPISVLIFTLIIFLFSLCIFFPWAEPHPLFFFLLKSPLHITTLWFFSFFSFPGLTRLWCLHSSSTNLVWSCFCCDNNKTIIDGQTQACLHIYAFDVSGHV